MAHKANPKDLFNWRVRAELLQWVRDESDRRDCSMSDVITAAVKEWRETHGNQNGDGQ
jgi:hypothetical protein